MRTIDATPGQVELANDFPAGRIRKRSGPKSRSSPYKGVTQYRRTGKWEAHIWVKGSGPRSGHQRHLGSYETPEEAAQAFDRATIRFRGPDEELNFPYDTYKECAFLRENARTDRFKFLDLLRERFAIQTEPVPPHERSHRRALSRCSPKSNEEATSSATTSRYDNAPGSAAARIANPPDKTAAPQYATRGSRHFNFEVSPGLTATDASAQSQRSPTTRPVMFFDACRHSFESAAIATESGADMKSSDELFAAPLLPGMIPMTTAAAAAGIPPLGGSALGGHMHSSSLQERLAASSSSLSPAGNRSHMTAGVVPGLTLTGSDCGHIDPFCSCEELPSPALVITETDNHDVSPVGGDFADWFK